MSALWERVKSILNRKNIDFYSLKCKGKPLDNIDTIHEKYYAQYDFLEENNYYMEWLFPIFGSAGINPHTKPLTMQEANLIKNNINTSIRVVKSYKLLLNFLGMKLVNDLTGEVGREQENWEARYCHLNTRTNNTVKITRMLKSLGQLGFERYQKGFAQHLKTEIEDNGLLKNLRDSFKNYWSSYLKLSDDLKNESVFFQHAQSQSADYRRYVEAEEKFLKQNQQKLKEIYDALKGKVDKNQLYSFENSNEGVGATSYFKCHYNSEEEEQKARIDFLESIKKGRNEAEEKRQRALKNLSGPLQTTAAVN
jgi:hypothetical protein